MRSRRVILRFLPLGIVAMLLGSVMAWQDSAERRLGEDVNASPEVVVSEHDVPVVEAADPVPEQAEKLTTAPKIQAAAPSGPRTVAELAPTKVKPFSMVGVTWRSGVPNDAAVEVRWRQDGNWSQWSALENDVQNTWTEGGRPGTEAEWVDHADAVAVRVRADEPSVPRDLRVATVDPGSYSGTTAVAASVGQPPIILRSSWGAKGNSGCDSPIYGATTRGAVIHHTAGSNSYTKSDSASIVRATQAYHMNSRGWCDIGYNFLIDKYGQIFEGRAGGIDKPVRAAHSGNGPVNEETMGVSLMGTFTSVEPSSAMKSAATDLVAWRFSRYGIPAKGTYSLGGKTLNRIAGHRNVVSTECPGTKAYAWLSASGGLRDRVADLLAGGNSSGGGSTGTAVPTGLHSTAQTTSSLTFGWNTVDGAPRYRIQLSTSSSMSGATYYRFIGTSGTISGLKANTKYYAKIRTIEDDGTNLSPYSSARDGYDEVVLDHQDQHPDRPEVDGADVDIADLRVELGERSAALPDPAVEVVDDVERDLPPLLRHVRQDHRAQVRRDVLRQDPDDRGRRHEPVELLVGGEVGHEVGQRRGRERQVVRAGGVVRGNRVQGGVGAIEQVVHVQGPRLRPRHRHEPVRRRGSRT